VVAVARGQEELERVVGGIRAEGGAAHALTADIGDKQATYAIAGAAAALVGPVSLLIHNASTLGPLPLRPLLDTDCEDLEAVLNTNLVGPFRLTKVIAGAMALHGGGTVLHLSSDAAVSAYATWGAYGISKAAQDHLARILATEMRGTGVRVLSVDPGEMDTRMHADAMPDADRTQLAQPARVAEIVLKTLESEVASGTRLEASSGRAS
jgi:NAD(P)-dependent dehydrogenase (short-subunit alcohol dehydrogenase family)